MSLVFQADQRSVNGNPYSRQYGLRVEGVRLISPKLWVGGSAEASRQTALGLNGPIGRPGLSWNGQTFANYALLPSLNVRFMGGLGREKTDRISTRHRSRWVGVMGSYDLPFGFTVTGAQQMFLTDFEQPNRLFSPAPPRNQTVVFQARLPQPPHPDQGILALAVTDSGGPAVESHDLQLQALSGRSWRRPGFLRYALSVSRAGRQIRAGASACRAVS